MALPKILVLANYFDLPHLIKLAYVYLMVLSPLGVVGNDVQGM
jgi:hypothetical protein